MYNFTLSAFADEIDAKLSKQIEVLKKHDIAHMELRSIDGVNVSKFTLPYAKEVKKELDANGIKVSAIGSPIGKIRLDDNLDGHMDLLKHVIELAETFETKYIRLFSFYAPEGKALVDCKEEVIENMNRMVDVAKDSSVILLHENEKDIYGEKAKECLEVLEAVNSPKLRATFDPANFVQVGQEVYPEAYDMLKDYIEYFHVKDAFFETKSIVPAGYGDGQFKELIARLKADNFNGFLSLEPHLYHFEGFADLELNNDSGVKEITEENEKEVKFALAVNSLKALI